MTLPHYDLGPGAETDEVLANIVIYGMLIALVASCSWIVLLFVQHGREQRRDRRTDRRREPTPAD